MAEVMTSSVDPAAQTQAREAGRAASTSRGVYLLDRSGAERHRIVRGVAPDTGLSIGKARKGAGGWLEVRVGRSDMLYLQPLSPSQAGAPAIAPAAVRDPGFRHGYWFTIAGADVGKVFAHGCEMDMRFSRFANLAVTQTLLFRTAVTIVRDDVDGAPAYHLLGCNSLAHHVDRKIRHVQALHGGRPIDISDLQASSR